MGRNKASIGERELALALAERESLREWKTVFKLSAIVAYAKHTAETVAPIFGVTTETVIRWAASFKKSGVEGLRDKARGTSLAKTQDGRESSAATNADGRSSGSTPGSRISGASWSVGSSRRRTTPDSF